MFLTEYCEACSNISKTAKECFKLSDEHKVKIKKKKIIGTCHLSHCRFPELVISSFS